MNSRDNTARRHNKCSATIFRLSVATAMVLSGTATFSIAGWSIDYPPANTTYATHSNIASYGISAMPGGQTFVLRVMNGTTVLNEITLTATTEFNWSGTIPAPPVTGWPSPVSGTLEAFYASSVQASVAVDF